MKGPISRRWHHAPAAVAEAAPGYPAWLVRDVALQDGREVHLRPILPSDAAELRRAVEHTDPETLRRRFLGARPPRTDQQFEHLVCVDYHRRLAVAALGADGQGVGIARYEAVGDTDTAEVAVTVDRAWRHVGLATVLVQLLAAAAMKNGIRRFTAEFFADNLDVADLLADAGAPYQRSDSPAGVSAAEVELPHDDAEEQ